MGICGDSGVFDFRDECVRSSWTALVPVGFLSAVCLVSVLSPKPWSVFTRFLTLEEADTLVLKRKEEEDDDDDELERPRTATEPDDERLPVWKTMVIVFVGMLEAMGWAIVGLYPLVFDSYSESTATGEDVWRVARPLFVAGTWIYAVVRRVRHPTPVPLYDTFAFYVLQLVAGTVDLGGVLYGHSVLGFPKPSTVEVVGYSLNLVAIMVVIVVVLSMPVGLPSRDIKKEEIGKSIAPEDYTTLWGWISFTWVWPLLSRGKSSTLNESDVWNLSSTLQSRPLLQQFMTTDPKSKSLLKRLCKANSLDLIIDALGTLMSSACMYLGPFFLNHILMSIEKDAALVTPADRSNAYIYACLMLLAALTKTQVDVQHLWFGRRAATRIRSELMAAIYDKALKRKDVAGGAGAGGERDKETSEPKSDDAKPDTTKKENEPKTQTRADIGKVVNLMAADADTISNTVIDMSFVWASPMDIVFGCVYLYQLLGWSAFAGFAVILAQWPLNTLLARRGITIQKGAMAARDNRMGVLNELVGAVKFIKLFAWEDRWIRRVMEARNKELSWIVKARINAVFYSLLWMSAPILISIVSFATYVFQGNDLTVSKAFTAIALFGMIRHPLNVLPNWIIAILNTKVALDRIAAFLGEEEVDERVSTLKAFASGGRPISVGQQQGLGLRNATLKWNEVPKDITKNEGQSSTSRFGSLSRRRRSSSKGAPAEEEATTSSSADSTVRSDTSDHRFELRDVSVMFPEGELTVVTGPTASGKTALLMAVLGEMTLLSGELVLHKKPQVLRTSSSEEERERYTQTISYASQAPWLRHQTIKENILFGYPYEPERYRQVVEACALLPDFDVLEDQDETEIGAGGVSLSGGQKARVALARAVYARTQYVLLDDPLSAVDSHTSRYLYENLLCGPLLRGRTVVLVTHHVDLVIPRAHYLVRMLDGRVDTQGTVRELRERGLLDSIASEEGVQAHRQSLVVEEKEEKGVVIPDSPLVMGKKPRRKLVKDEHRETGSVKWKVYKKYLEASSYYIWILLACFVVLGQLLGVGEKFWMMQWGRAYRNDDMEASHDYAADSYTHSQHHLYQVPLYDAHAASINASKAISTNSGSHRGWLGINWPNAHDHPLFYVGIYAAIGLGSVLLNVFTVIAQYTGALRASRVLFKQLLEKIVRATFRFHDTTPQGRMLNRFGKDIETIDNALARSLSQVNSVMMSFFACVITIIAVFPLFLLPAAVFGFVYRELAIAYLNTGRDLRRMENNTRSPIFSHFGELLEGIVTVRAFSAERQFLDGIHKKIDATTKMWHGFWMTNRWLMLNFHCIGAVAVFITALFSISRVDDAAAGIAGVCISSALSFTDTVYWACRFWTNMELDLNSVERVIEYLEVPQEPPAIIESNRPPAYWPSSSAKNDSLIRVENLSVKYAPDLPDVLHDVSFTLRAGERVGLLGRTGSGKSTLAMSVLRFVDPSSGRILIDGIDISMIGTYDLRSRLTFIPQDARLFSGTLRDNLDPFNEHTDEECLDVLYRVQIIQPGNEGGPRKSSNSPSTSTSQPPSVHGDNSDESQSATTIDVEGRSSNNAITLSTEISSGGTNFSQGQRQLISLARALLRRSSIIVLDEATSSIDFTTDEKIQTAIREEFGQSLLLTVAHRLRTVIDYDRLIVLDNGRVAEFDTPVNLIQRKDGIFRNMCLKSGTFLELEAAAVAKKQSGMTVE
ncbi:hypothetical protein L218DRAFT_873993 [Marasmius fiardii PR-910]|nr:hypothetical protein L218DRAFT_873993 [Marasmius fiardii PR-910]